MGLLVYKMTSNVHFISIYIKNNFIKSTNFIEKHEFEQIFNFFIVILDFFLNFLLYLVKFSSNPKLKHVKS